MRKLIFTVMLWTMAVLPAYGAQALNIRSVQFSGDEGQESVTIRLSEATEFRQFTLSNPERMVIDLPTADFADQQANFARYKGAYIKSMRFGQNTAERSRLVFDLKRHPASIRSVTTEEEGGTRITIVLGDKDVPVAPPEKPMIIIDPGHGGQDPGAIGEDGEQEKDITLATARKLRDALIATGKFRAALTRDKDIFILLRDRVQIARKQGAKMFVSLHVNSAPVKGARGASIYTLSDNASDQEAGMLAARENKADLIAGMDLNGASQDVANILIDLAQRETNGKSAKLSAVMVKALGKEVKLLQNSHRSAGFAVLKAPDIPSVLVEVGFITNPHEVTLLTSEDYQEQLAEGLANGIDGYFAGTGIRH